MLQCISIELNSHNTAEHSDSCTHNTRTAREYCARTMGQLKLFNLDDLDIKAYLDT